MKSILSFFFFLGLISSVAFSQAGHQNINSKKVAIQGYDAVSYFNAHKAIQGLTQNSTTYQGATYYFCTTQNLAAFKASPEKYAPQYGGWCAYAMGATGEKVEIDPSTFKIINGRLYLFYNKYFNNTLNSWNQDEKTLLPKADKNWVKIAR